MALAWTIFGISLFALWISGHWLGMALALAGALVLMGDAIWPNALLMPLIAVAPFAIRKLISRTKAVARQ